MTGIKETKELLVGVNELSIFLISRLRDGLDTGDFVAFYKKITEDDKFVDFMKVAYQDIGKVPEELGDIDLFEGFELSKLQLEYVPKILEALGKK